MCGLRGVVIANLYSGIAPHRWIFTKLLPNVPCNEYIVQMKHQSADVKRQYRVAFVEYYAGFCKACNVGVDR
jgi:hypothetical protein